MKRLLLHLGVVVCVLALIVGCGSRKNLVTPESVVDQPGVHIQSGYELFDRGDYSGALASFKRAVDINDENPVSLCGLGLALLFAEGDTEGALKLAKEAIDIEKKYAPAYVLRGYIDMPGDIINVIIKGGLSEYSEDVSDWFDKALKYGSKDPWVKYWVAVGYEKLLEFEQAKALFLKLAEEGPYVSSANDHLRRINNIERLAPTTELGKAIALLEKVTRGEASAMICLELKPGRYLDLFPDTPVPEDAVGNWAQLFIEEVVQTGLIEADEDGMFKPGKPFKRVEFALTYMRLLIGFSNDFSLATKYVDSDIGYGDMDTNHPVFNAVRITVENGLLDATDGYFRPKEAVSGVDVLEMTSWLRKAYERNF